MKEIRVKDIYKIYGVASLAISKDSSLDTIISSFAHDPSLRAIFLTDASGRFLGEITQIDLVKWVHLQCHGSSSVIRRFEGVLSGHVLSAWEISRLISATKAVDLALSNYQQLGIKEDDTLQTALDKMIDYGTTILPVLDSQGKILGDLRLSEILVSTIETRTAKG